MELRDRAFDAAEEVVVQARLHGRFRGLRQNRLRTGDLHFRQLRRPFPQCGRGGADTGGDQSGNHRRVRGDVVERGGRAEISHQNRPAILVIRARAVGDAVRAHVLRIVHADVESRFDARSHDHRIDVEELHDARTERMHDLRHHGRNDHIIDIRRLVAAQSQELRDHQPVFVGRVVRLRGDAVRARDAPIVDKTDHDVRVADIHSHQKHVAFSFAFCGSSVEILRLLRLIRLLRFENAAVSAVRRPHAWLRA